MLKPNQIFVFGSNTQGRHGKGAAKWAVDHAGAVYGQAQGRQGQSYAIITKDLTKKTHPSVLPGIIISQITGLYNYAIQHPELEFLVPYKANSDNLNGYTPLDMAELFACRPITPVNIIFEKGFSELVEQCKVNKAEQ